MRVIATVVLGLAGLLANDNAFALTSLGNGVYCQKAGVIVGNATAYYEYVNCTYFPSGVPGSDGGVPYPSAGGGGGGGGSDAVVDLQEPTEPEDIKEIKPATRCSSVDVRHDHAAKSWKVMYKRLISVYRGIPAGRLIRITYDDGSSELWVLSGALMTDPFPGGPVPNTLFGGKSCGGSGGGGFSPGTQVR